MSDRPGEMDERDVDERFASIVASWEPTDTDLAVGPAEDTAESGSSPAQPTSPVNPSPVAGLVPASSWRVVPPSGLPAAPDEDDTDHFEPPRVELPPQEDLHFWGAVLGLVAGPLCLVYVAMARPFHSTRWFLAGLLLSLVGFALLVLRQPRDRDENDDGARV